MNVSVNIGRGSNTVSDVSESLMQNKAFFCTKLTLNVVSVKGDYVRQWVPELGGIKGGDVHTPWTLSNSALSHAKVSLNETYPSPIVIAPEWSRHVNNKSVRLLTDCY